MSRWLGRHWARLSYSRFVEPFWLETNQLDLPIPHLDPGLSGLKILQLTDFHLCGRVPASLIRQAIEAGNRQQCDLIALTGDFVQAGFHYIGLIAKLLAKLKAPLGVYAVLGNHDYSIRNAMGVRRFSSLPGAITDALQSEGIHVLHNQHHQLTHHGAPVAVAGVADLWSRETHLPLALAGIPDDVPRIVLAHNPCSVEELEGRRCDLMLSGHTHGGQVHLPGWGHLGLSRRMQDYASGLYYHGSGYLYVNKGIGYTVRFRFNVRPEIAVLTLRSARLDGLCDP